MPVDCPEVFVGRFPVQKCPPFVKKPERDGYRLHLRWECSCRNSHVTADEAQPFPMAARTQIVAVRPATDKLGVLSWVC